MPVASGTFRVGAAPPICTLVTVTRAGRGEGLGQDELAASAAAILGVTSGNSNRICEALTSGSVCRQGDLGGVDLIGLGIAGGTESVAPVPSYHATAPV